MVGFGAPRRTGRLPPFVLVALLVVIALLAFNYWSVSGRQAALQEELAALQEQVQRTEVARSRLEKRHSDLMVQAESSRRQLEQRLGDYHNVGERLQARDKEAQRCEADRERLLANVTQQMADSSHLKDQLNDLRQEIQRQEYQLLEYKNNATLLQKALKEESLQCSIQMADQKRQYEESIRKLQLAGGDKLHLKELAKNDIGGGEAGTDKLQPEAPEPKDLQEEDPSNNVHFNQAAAKVVGDGDAGMPEIEANEPAKQDIVPTGEKKEDVGGLPHNVEESEKQPSLPPASIANAQGKLFATKDYVEGLLPENCGHINKPGTPRKLENIIPEVLKEQAVQIEDNAINMGQLPEKQPPKDSNPMIFPNIKQSRFFDENESPVDQHGSKVADYNGDDGNVGEYEADKQAELAYNEEEDGDGGEEDVQDDENDGQGEAAEYRKDHFGENL